MVSGSTKRIVVIKDIPSNIIEEAILILKSEPGNKEDKSAKDFLNKNKKRDNDFLFKEAESVIDNYIRENKMQVISNPREPAQPKKPKITGNKTLINTIINVGLMASIAILVFIITRFL